MTQNNQNKLSRSEVIQELWRRGNLSWKLKSNQKEIYDLFYNSEHKTHTWLLSRRSGKTYSLALLAIEACIKNKNTIVKFLAPTKLQINTILRPIMRDILTTCPEELKPDYRSKDYIYYFPNGSEIQLAGSEAGHAEKLRGGSSNIAIVDEAQDVTDLDNIVKSILLPTTLTTKGKVILSGTPPKDPDHEFVRFIEEADLRGSLVKKTVYDNPMLSTHDIEELIVELGGINSDAAQRELFCNIVRDKNTSVIPEFTAELEKEIVQDIPKPTYFDSYESMDLGFKDLTVVLFGYFDFKHDRVVIEDEIALTGQELKLPDLVSEIRKREELHWTNPLTNELRKPFIRVSDINYIVTSEISRISNGEINFIAARKDDKQAAINQLRILLSSKKLVINPRCKTLIRHLRNVKWNKSKREEFARSPDDGHYDAVDALIYMVRHISYGKNPYPPGYGMNTKDLYITNPGKYYQNDQLETYKKIFNIKRK